MRMLTDEEVTKIILEQGPLTTEELARMAYPVRVTYLALMLSWAKEHGLDNLVEQKETLRPMVLRGLEEMAGFIASLGERLKPGPKPKTGKASGPDGRVVVTKKRGKK